MKNNKTKMVIAISLICIVIGSVLLGAGFAMGGNLSSMHIGKDNTNWWPFEGSLGINLIDENEDGKDSEAWDMPLDDITNLSIDMDLGDVKIKKGTESKIRFYHINEKNVKVKQNGDEKEIKIKRSGIHLNEKNVRMEITLSKQAYRLEVDNHLGDITINDVNFDQIDVDANMGDITLQNVRSKHSDINNDCGDIKMDGIYQGKTSVENKLGDIKMEITGDENTYDFDVENKLGDTHIQDRTYEFKSDIKEQRGKANSLEIECHLGDIKVLFR